MVIGIAMGVMMVVMMGAMFLGGHHGMLSKQKDHESASVAVSSPTVQSSTVAVHEDIGSKSGEHHP